MQTASLGQATDIDMMNIQTNSTSRLSTAQKAKALGKGASAEKMEETAKEFEAQFISQMMENMFSTVDTNGPLGGGDAEETYRSMLVNEYGKMIARTGGIGVADQVKREMIRMQEVE